VSVDDNTMWSTPSTVVFCKIEGDSPDGTTAFQVSVHKQGTHTIHSRVSLETTVKQSGGSRWDTGDTCFPNPWPAEAVGLIGLRPDQNSCSSRYKFNAPNLNYFKLECHVNSSNYLGLDDMTNNNILHTLVLTFTLLHKLFHFYLLIQKLKPVDGTRVIATGYGS